MSDRTGSIPGTVTASPDIRPVPTSGRDIDLAYFQTGTPDNHLRAICAHIEGGVDQRHCIRAPERLDARRTGVDRFDLERKAGR